MSNQISVPNLQFDNQKSLVAQFNSRRVDESLKFKTELQHLHSCLVANEDLRDCEPDSFGETVIQAAEIGLSLHPRLGHAYPVPYKVNGRKRCTLTLGYQGMTHLAMKAGTVKSVQTNVVCKNDPEFRVWTDEKGSHIAHTQARENRGEVTHAYCIAHFANGGYHIEVMDKADLEACENAAKTKYVWRGPFRIEMMKKSAERRAWKHWPKDDGGRLERAIDIMDQVEPMDFEESQEPEVCLNDDDTTELHAMLTEQGLDGDLASKWLKRIATVNGFASVSDIPARLKDKIREDLNGYLKQYKAQHAAA